MPRSRGRRTVSTALGGSRPHEPCAEPPPEAHKEDSCAGMPCVAEPHETKIGGQRAVFRTQLPPMANLLADAPERPPTVVERTPAVHFDWVSRFTAQLADGRIRPK